MVDGFGIAFIVPPASGRCHPAPNEQGSVGRFTGAPVRSAVMSVGARPLVPSRLTPGGVVHGVRRVPTTVLGAYVALTKPRIIELLLVTTLPAMVLAEQGWPSTALVAWTILGGALAAGGANAINMVIDRDIDRLMPRTQGRPLVTGLIAPRPALVFALTLEGLAFVVLVAFANLLAAALAISGTLFYVFVYSLWLKRTSTSNIVIGGAAGAVPALVGWAAVTGSLAWPPVVLFLVIFFWTPPHFWALAIRFADDYRAANVPMLPAVVPVGVAVRKMVAYTVVMVLTTLVLAPVADLGPLYIVAAVVCGALFLWGSIDLGRAPTPSRAMRLFAFSITYVTLLFGALTLDVLLRHGF
jgi:heme o synthase